jgi:hypothetical protein
MWRRARGRSLAPRRPAVFAEQWPLVIITALAVIGGIAAVVVILSS